MDFVFHEIIDNSIYKILPKENSENIRCLFLIREEIFKIFAKTKDSSSGIIRLKWLYDNIEKKQISSLDIDNKKNNLEKFLNNISYKEMRLLLEYISSFTPMLGRYELSSIYDEFLASLNESFKSVFEQLSSSKISDRTILKYNACLFLSMKFIFIKGGWNFSKDQNIYINQMKEIFTKSELANYSSYSKIDNFIDKVYSGVFYENFCSNINNINESPKVNIGLLILRALFYRFFG